MIKEIFLPEKFQGRRLISRRIVGIMLDETTISAAQAYATSSSTTVERVHEEQIPPGAPNRYSERAAQVMTSVLSNFKKYDQIKICISSSIVTFKELTVPFLDLDKIRMVIEYEVEPKLPFSISEAVVDFIVTSQDKEKKTSQILVAAARVQDLQEIFDICKLANVDPESITVDLFALYGLYLNIPTYKNLAGASTLIDVGSTTTSVAFLLDGQLRLIRNIAKGLDTIAQHISDDTGESLEAVLENLKTFGLEKTNDEAYTMAAQKYVTNFLTDIQFTLNSFSLKLNFYDEISMVLFTSKGTKIRGLTEFSNTILQVRSELLVPGKLFKAKEFKNKTRTFGPDDVNNALALGTATTYGPHDEFNLRRKEFAKVSFPLMNKQIFVGALLTVVMLLSLGVRGYLQISELNSALVVKQKQAITQLKKIFPPGHKSKRKTNLNGLFRDAKKYIQERKTEWEPFLQENLQPLQVLKDLTQTMDKRSFNIKIQKIAISLDGQGKPLVDLSGQFVSRPGSHYSDYGKFEKYFEQNSKLLTFRETALPELLEEEKGVGFTFMLKLKSGQEETEEQKA